ncbi:Nuclear envelope morphology protein 1 [Nowakowskiella sp. JEL0407]|nr:Nuclear envelope morphology protein 1 [Nowakowskiella sp. JEL0407]
MLSFIWNTLQLSKIFPDSKDSAPPASQSVSNLTYKFPPNSPGATSTTPVRRKLIRKNSFSHSESDSSDTQNSPRRLARRAMRIQRALVSPRKTKTLVLDLDETLIHSSSRGSRNHDHTIEVLVDKHVCLYYVYKRPHTDYFLRKVSLWYKVVIFTASMPEYADPVIDWLDSNRTLISKRYFRQSCTPHGANYMKNLALVEPDLSQVCLIDNSNVSFGINPGKQPRERDDRVTELVVDNGIPISSWMNDPHDDALLDLLPFLDALRFTDDVRSVLALRV